MNKREADFQVVFNKYLRKKGLTGVFELKQTTGKTIRFNVVKEHQIEGLRAAQNSGFVWKLSDADIRMKPFDVIAAPPLRAYIVIKFPGIFHVIPLDAYIAFRDSIGKSALTIGESCELAEHTCSF